MIRRIEKVGQKKPWRPPPIPLPRDWTEILAEIPSVLGLEIGMLVRQLRLAANWNPEKKGLFAPRTALHVGERRIQALSEAPRELREPMRVLMRLTGRRPPEPTELVAACEAVVTWALEAGHSSTAVQVAEAGAVFAPRDPQALFVAGRTNRIAGEGWRAEIFYHRSIRYAYRQQKKKVYVRANLGLARLLTEQGRWRVAAGHLDSAATVALDQGEEWLAAQTYHDLLLLHFAQGNENQAYEYALKAVRTYPVHNERYPAAVHDLAFAILVCKHRYVEALPLLNALANAPLPSQERITVWGTLGRTAGGLKLRDRFADAESQVLQLAPHYPLFAPAAFLNLAFGAHALGDWMLGVHYAEKGVALARERQDSQVLRAGEELLTSLYQRKPAPAPAPPLDEELAEELGEVAENLERQIAAWHSNSWTRKQDQAGVATLGPV